MNPVKRPTKNSAKKNNFHSRSRRYPILPAKTPCKNAFQKRRNGRGNAPKSKTKPLFPQQSKKQRFCMIFRKKTDSGIFFKRETLHAGRYALAPVFRSLIPHRKAFTPARRAGRRPCRFSPRPRPAPRGRDGRRRRAGGRWACAGPAAR